MDVLVLGAGPSGLAVGACLRTRGVRFDILERADAVAHTWRNHYERLHLHTVKQYSALPHMPWAEHVPMYPARADVLAYLDAYAERFNLAPRFGETVTRVRRVDGAWQVDHTTGSARARAVVIATGYNRTPNIPTWPGQELFTGEVMHSRAYRNGKAWRGKRALVVGAGNSGAEIALDLWEWGAQVALCIRHPVHVVPRDVWGIPAQVNSLRVMSRLPIAVADRLSIAMLDRIVGDLRPWGIERPALGPIAQLERHGRVPLIDVGTLALIKQRHLTVVPGITRFEAQHVTFDDTRSLPFDVVVLATGYRAAIDDFLDDAARHLDARGLPYQHGVESDAPGLYFIGYRNPVTGALHDIAREAARVADHIARRRR
jgi:cation diffusion facilitator CzcD-associated flavoprotein CzcO